MGSFEQINRRANKKRVYLDMDDGNSVKSKPTRKLNL